MPSLQYPLTSTSTGDLALTTDSQTIAIDRARLYLDCIRGDRPYLSGFGIEVGLFQPEVPRSIQDAQLQRDLDRWCGTGYQVVDGDVRWMG